jgi:hypothetical protein
MNICWILQRYRILQENYTLFKDIIIELSIVSKLEIVSVFENC